MKRNLISFLILVFASSCSAIAPAPTATLLTTITNTPLPTATPTSIPTETPEPTVTPIPFEQMTDEQKLASAPVIDGLTKSNFSELKSNLLIYRDENGKAQKVYNFLDKSETSLTEAGIIEFELEGGGTLELISVDNVNELVDYIIHNEGTIWGEGGINERMKYTAHMFPESPSPELLEHNSKIRRISGFESIGIQAYPYSKDSGPFFGISFFYHR